MQYGALIVSANILSVFKELPVPVAVSPMTYSLGFLGYNPAWVVEGCPHFSLVLFRQRPCSIIILHSRNPIACSSKDF